MLTRRRPPAVVDRRRFLLGAGVTGLTVGLGACAAPVHGAAHGTPAPSPGAAREAAGAAFPALPDEPGHWGTHRVVWSVPTTAPLAAITFDDGPTPAYTPRILDALAAAGVTATFFMMGHNAAAHRSLVAEVVAAGHEVGSHTWSHLDLAKTTPTQTRDEIVRGREAVEDAVQRPLVGFRPPRGELSGYALRVCAELGQDVFLWSCTRGPDGTGTAAAVTDHLVQTVGPGAVVDLHDGLGRGTFAPAAAFTAGLAARREVEVRALPTVLRRIADRGLTLTTAGRLLTTSAAAAPATH